MSPAKRKKRKEIKRKQIFKSTELPLVSMNMTVTQAGLKSFILQSKQRCGYSTEMPLETLSHSEGRTIKKAWSRNISFHNQLERYHKEK